ncbi:OmpA family protein [Ottowia thiooxydans]|uniref:Outer membrane protein OmpA-like peptidoglycan-associated protein n=1 Tax=Ottowia thiooxydans TaxID=219182 RepID=A0ABV2QFE5_9BURK
MKRTIFSSRALVLSVTAAAVFATGCANMTETQRNTGIGAGIGAVAGGLIGDGGGAAIGAGVGALGGYAWSRYMENKKAEMQRATAGTGVQVTQTQDNQLKLNIPNDISFTVGRADIQPALRPILDQFANGLGTQPNTEVVIVGHTDSTGSDAINNPLSVERANSVRDYLSARGVDSRRVRTEGRGSHEPIANNGTDAGRAQNRRVEIFLAERAVAAAPVQQQPMGAPMGTPIGTPARY